MIIKKQIIFFEMFFLLIGLANASDVKTLTLDDCLKIGMEKSKTIMISNSKIEQADARIKELDAAFEEDKRNKKIAVLHSWCEFKDSAGKTMVIDWHGTHGV